MGATTNVSPRWLRPILLVALGCSAVAPLAMLLLRSLGRAWFYPALWPTTMTVDSWLGVWQNGGRMAAAFGTSLGLAIATGALGAAFGWPIGRMLAGLRGWHRHVGAGAAFLPVAAPPIALATGLHLSILSLGLAGTAVGVLISHLVPAVGYVGLYFFGVFTVFDHRVHDEARTLGAAPRQVLWRVTLPMMRRQLADAFLLGFLVSWAQVALTLIVGGGRVRTLPIEVFAYLQAGQDRFASTGALLLVIPPLLALGAIHLAVARAEAVPL